MENERQYALRLGKTRQWYATTTAHFQLWANKSGIPWRAVKPHLQEVMEKARSLWPDALRGLPMDAIHKEQLVNHWTKLQPDFRIG